MMNYVYYLGRIAQISAEFSNILEDGHIILLAVVPEL